jgi:hypothetical protein
MVLEITMRSVIKKHQRFSALLVALVFSLLPANLAHADCYGTVYFEAPEGWSNTVYVVFNNAAVVVPVTVKDASSGYFVVDMSLYTAQAIRSLLIILPIHRRWITRCLRLSMQPAMILPWLRAQVR